MVVGALCWATAALFGLQALFAHFVCLYPASMLWRHAREPLPEMAPASTSHLIGFQGFLRALLLQLSNPKIMVFFGSIFLSVLPQHMPGWMDGVVLAIVAFDEFTWFAL